MIQQLEPTFFPTPAAFRAWLKRHGEKEKELLVGFYKKDSGRQGITWSESVDEALCFGWIDGIRRTINAESYSIRFTPRKPASIWSAVNIDKVATLTKQGLMQPAGVKAFSHRKESRSRVYAHEQEQVALSPEYEARLAEDKKALAYFQSATPSYRKIVVNWVMSARQEATREKRMNELISDCAAGRKIKSQRYGTP